MLTRTAFPLTASSNTGLLEVEPSPLEVRHLSLPYSHARHPRLRPDRSTSPKACRRFACW
jgi:hypothetical protein